MRLPVLVLAVVLLMSGCGATLGDTVAAWPAQVPPYDRDEFGDGWADADKDWSRHQAGDPHPGPGRRRAHRRRV